MSDLRSQLTALLRRPAGILPVQNPVRQGLSRIWDSFLRSTGRYVTIPIAGQPLRVQVGFRHTDPEYEAAATRILLMLVGPGDSVWDVGANIGIYTLLTGKAVGPTGRVAAWEPSPASFAILADHIAANGMTWCQPIQAAIGDGHACTVPFAILSETGIDSSNRMRLAHARNTVDVPAGTLDGWLDKLGWAPRLVKIDIEGAEVMALQGAQRLLGPGGVRPILLVAVHPQFLGEFGCRVDELAAIVDHYRYRSYDLTGRVDRPTEYAEYLFAPAERAREITAKIGEVV